MNVVDYFDSSSSGGLPTATNGYAWASVSGGGGDWSEAGGFATVTPSTAGATVRVQALSCTNGDGDIYLDFMFGSDPVGGTSQQIARLYVRLQSSASLNDGYRYTITKQVGGVATLGVARLNGGTSLPLGGGTINIPGDVVAATWYTLHVNLAALFQGANVYLQSDSEPVGYLRSFTDSGATWATGAAVAIGHQATTGNTNLSPLHFDNLVGSVSGAIAPPPPPVVVAKWPTRPGADHGGGYSHCGEADPLNPGRYATGGDTWGIHITSDGGNSWRKRMRGCSVTTTGSVGPDMPIRALAFSKRPSTNGSLFVSQGRIHGASTPTGFFGWLAKDETTSIVKSTQVPGGGTVYAASAGQPRPAGELIVSEYSSSADTEYIYVLTPVGLYRTLNSSTQYPGQSAVALAFTATPQGWRWMLQVDATTLYCATWNVDMATLTTMNTIVYKVVSTGAPLATCTSGQVTVTPLTGTPSHVNAIKLIGGNLYAAGIDGVYLITNNGTVWTKISGTVFSGECMAIGGTGNTIYAVNKASSTNPTQTILRSTNGAASTGSDWQFLVTSDGSNLSGQIWGDGNLWWLYKIAADPARLNNNPVTGAGSSFTASNIIVDPFDPTKITIWHNGAWQSRDSGATWRPSMFGLNGAEKHAQRLDGSLGAVTTLDHDYGASQTLDRYRTAIDNSSPGTAFPALSLTMTQNGHTYTVSATKPAALLQDGAVISDTYFENACIDPTDLKVDIDNTIYISQSGGGVLVVDQPRGALTGVQVTLGQNIAAAPGDLTVSDGHNSTTDPTNDGADIAGGA